MPKVSLRIEPPVKLPRFSGLSQQFWREVGDATVVSTIENIGNQVEASGRRLKRNAPSTIRMKRKLGLGVRSLIAKQRSFVQRGSWAILKYLPGGRGIIVGANDIMDLVKKINWTWAKGYRGYLGINKRARAAIAVELKREIVRQFKKASRG